MTTKPAVSLVAVAGRRKATLDLAQTLEREGFTGIYCPSPGDGLSLCAALALVTREIPFGTSIAHIYTRHVFEWAQTAAVIHELAGGRFRFGVGVSHGPAHARLGLNPGKPLDDVRRFVTELKTYAPQVGALPPITLATLRRKMVALAGEIAEGAVWANAARSHMAESLRHLSDARRNDPSFFVGNMLPTCIDPDRVADRRPPGGSRRAVGVSANLALLHRHSAAVRELWRRLSALRALERIGHRSSPPPATRSDAHIAWGGEAGASFAPRR